MNIGAMPEPYCQRKVDLGKFVTDFWGVLYWGKERQPFQKPWAADAEDLVPNAINVIKKRREVSVMGFGGDLNEAYHSCLAKLEDRLDRRGWDFILIESGVPLRNGANFQYHMAATLYKIDRNYRAPAIPSPSGLQNELAQP